MKNKSEDAERVEKRDEGEKYRTKRNGVQSWVLRKENKNLGIGFGFVVEIEIGFFSFFFFFLIMLMI